MNEFVANVQDKMKNSTLTIITSIVKFLSGLWMGTLVATIAQTMMGSGTLTFVFIVVLSIGLIFRLLKEWNLFSIVVFNLVFFLTAVLLRMYIYMAPEVVL